MAQIDEMTIMAYADGELSEDQAALVEAALETDPTLQRQLDKYRRLNTEIMAAFSDIAAAPVPEKLLETMHATPRDVDTHGTGPVASKSNILSFSAFKKRPEIVWPALAAAAMGLFILSNSLQQGTTVGPHQLLPRNVAIVADNTLSTAKNGITVGGIEIIASYKRVDGSICRTFHYKDSAPYEAARENTATVLQKEALACQQNANEWTTVAVITAIPANAYFPAGADSSMSMQQLIRDIEPVTDFPPDK